MTCPQPHSCIVPELWMSYRKVLSRVSNGPNTTGANSHSLCLWPTLRFIVSMANLLEVYGPVHTNTPHSLPLVTLHLLSPWRPCLHCWPCCHSFQPGLTLALLLTPVPCCSGCGDSSPHCVVTSSPLPPLKSTPWVIIRRDVPRTHLHYLR